MTEFENLKAEFDNLNEFQPTSFSTQKKIPPQLISLRTEKKFESKIKRLEKSRLSESTKSKIYNDDGLNDGLLGVFGHTITSMNNGDNVVLFGGQKGSQGKIFMQGDTFKFDKRMNEWT